MISSNRLTHVRTSLFRHLLRQAEIAKCRLALAYRGNLER